MEIKKVFSKYNDDIERLEYKNFQPITNKQYFNQENQKIIFKIDAEDDFIVTNNIQYNISGEYKPGSGTDEEKKNIKLIDNFVPYLFSKIEIKKNGVIIDEIEDPGVVSTVKKYAYYNGDKGEPQVSGLYSGFVGGGNFSAVGKLNYLGLGFCNDIDIPIYRAGLEIIFTRNHNNNALHRFDKDITDPPTLSADGKSIVINTRKIRKPGTGSVEIKNFYIKVPIIHYDNTEKIKLINDITNVPYPLQFKQWQCIEYRNISGNIIQLNITDLYRNIDNPIWGFIVFQVSRNNNQEKDNSIFDHSDVKNIWLELGGKRYPEENYDIDFEEDNFGEIYDAFKSYQKYYAKNSVNQLDAVDFKNKAPIYSFNLTFQPGKVSSFKNNIIVNIQFSKRISNSTANDGTICYIILLSNVLFNYDPIKNKVIKDI